MENSIRILILEHDQNDIDLLQYQLKKSRLDYVSQVVQTREEFEKEICSFSPEIILSDFSLPSFDGVSAFQIKQKLAAETPFIIVSGTIGEENAVELIKKGVTDYVLKEKLYGIGPKILRALAEANERKQKVFAEHRLRQSEEQLQKILNCSMDVICTVDGEGKFVKVGAGSKQVLGYQPEEMEGRGFKDFIYKEDEELNSRIATDIINGLNITNFENRYVRKDGTIVPLIWSMRWDANDKIMYSVARDATEIKEAEKKIRNNEKRFRALLQNSADGLILLSADGALLEVSSSARKILKIDIDSVIGKIKPDLVHPDDLPICAQTFFDVLNDPDVIKTIELRYLVPEGNFRWLESSFHNQLNEPSVGGIVLNFRDITERKLAEIAIKESEEKYRSLFQLSPFPMWVFELDTLKFLNVNDAACMHYGYNKDEFLNMTIFDIRPNEDIKNIETIISNNQFADSVIPRVFRHKKKSGELIQVEIRTNPIEFDGKKARIVLAVDISERMNHIQAIEEQNKRMREIAWEQSHIVRAPLARMMGLISILNNYTIEEVGYTDVLNHILTSANELDELIRKIVKRTEQLPNSANYEFENFTS